MPPARRRYRNPPLFEVVCELRFAPGAWNDAIPRRFDDRLALDRPDGSIVAEAAPGRLTLRQVPPFDRWAAFLAIIERAVDVYVKTAAPGPLERVGMRVRNRVTIPAGAALTDYLTLPANGVTLHDGRDRVLIEHDGDTLALDYTLARAGAVTPDGVAAWLDDAHDGLQDLFEEIVEDPLRATFD